MDELRYFKDPGSYRAYWKVEEGRVFYYLDPWGWLPSVFRSADELLDSGAIETDLTGEL